MPSSETVSGKLLQSVAIFGVSFAIVEPSASRSAGQETQAWAAFRTSRSCESAAVLLAEIVRFIIASVLIRAWFHSLELFSGRNLTQDLREGIVSLVETFSLSARPDWMPIQLLRRK
jgi:hypothetical protein